VPVFQPRGDLLAASAWDGTLRLWDPIRGGLIAMLPGGLRGWEGGGSRLVVAGSEGIIVYRVAGAAERWTIDCRALSDRPHRVQYGPARVEFSPDGRLIAMALRVDGVRIARASDGAPLARLPIGYCNEATFLPDGDLLTYNPGWGLCRWPVRRLPGGGRRLGPPEPLARIGWPLSNVYNGLAASPDGRLAGACAPGRPGALLLDPDRPRRRTWLVPHEEIRDLAISPDGRWAATAGWGVVPDSRRVKVWDVTAGRLLASLDVGYARVAISRDGRLLGVGGSGLYLFLRAGSWDTVAEVSHGAAIGCMPLAFHPGGRVAAVLEDASGGPVRLIEVETGRVLAALEPPESARTYALAFSPDGRYLAVSQYDQRVHIWDLARIRRRLDELGLAADFPDVSGGGAAPGGSTDDPDVERIEVVGADGAGRRWLVVRQALREGWFEFRGMFDPDLDDPEERLDRAARWMRLGQFRLAAVDYRAVLARRPDSLPGAISLIECLLVDLGGGDPGEAVRWARTAVARRPEHVGYHMHLGAALYRAGSFAEAAAELEPGLPRYQGGAGYSLLYLAMCRQRMGQTAAARAAFAEAVRWRAGRATQAARDPGAEAVFQNLLCEARSVLAEDLPDLPADVFAR
jgi:WD40 repeat protein